MPIQIALTVDTVDRFLSCESGGTTRRWESPQRWSERENACCRCRNSQRASNVGSDAQGTSSKCQQRRFTSRASTRGQRTAQRIQCSAYVNANVRNSAVANMADANLSPSKSIVHALWHHHCRWDICLDIDDGPKGLEQINKNAVLLMWLVAPRHKADG